LRLILQHPVSEIRKASAVKLSVIIPVHNGGDELRICLDALEASTRCPDEIVVVDDASTDGSGYLARQHGAVVLSLEEPPHGPAFARNRGADRARGDILVFLDADVAIHPDALALMEQYLTQHPEIGGVFGSYDAEPRAGGLVSRYKNLLHHYVHQHSRREASTFWGACGAIRREAFAALGGFKEDHTRPKVEDIEFGVRLHHAGHRVWLCPDVQVTHLKHWTFTSLLRVDIFDRAIPWARLILQDTRLPYELNLNTRSRLSAIAAWAALAFLIPIFRWPWAAMGTLLGVTVVAVLNADLYRFFGRQGGLRFAAGAAGLHLLYLLYSSLVFALVVAQTLLARLHACLRKPQPSR
jgi:glycosyltransferase involved in cell wall biosynthesis